MPDPHIVTIDWQRATNERQLPLTLGSFLHVLFAAVLLAAAALPLLAGAAALAMSAAGAPARAPAVSAAAAPCAGTHAGRHQGGVVGGGGQECAGWTWVVVSGQPVVSICLGC
jgi:hypothetical protein